MLARSWAHTKDRSEVSGGGKKPWKQKGNGPRARRFQPFSDLDWRRRSLSVRPKIEFQPEDQSEDETKALFMAFSDKLATGTLLVVDSLDFSEYKTKKLRPCLILSKRKS
jgi:large subunit ribosomal protein L4